MSHSMLSKEAFSAAQHFIEANARPLDQARFRLHFQDGSVDDLLSELAAYQNDDGGFGHALEPDVRAPESSAICTSVAFQILNEIRPLDGAHAALPMVERGITYLLKTVDRSERHWRIIPMEAATSPRAPWWHENSRGDFDAFALNPTAEILGILYDYSNQLGERIDSALLEDILSKVMETVATLEEIEMHDLYCVLRLQRADNLPAGLADQLGSQLAKLTRAAVVTDPAAWSGYGLRPLDVVDGPDSPFMAGLEDAVSANLDFEIGEQNKDGSWMPTWTWGELFPEVWPVAQAEWAGNMTVEKLCKLQRFGRIAADS